MLKRICVLLTALLLLSACISNFDNDVESKKDIIDVSDVPTPTIADRSRCVVSSVPEDYSFNSFYEKYCDADGIPVISSGEVEDLALQQAYYVIMNMLASIPEVRQELIANGAYFGVIGISEELTSLPEYIHMDSEYWDKRARGLGGSKEIPITTTAEENLLCLTFDRWYGESIAVHEFAHTISLMGIGADFEILESEFTGLYESAIQQELWINTYAGSNILEYWAEGVQSYFNTNLESEPTDGVHNYVNTREELADYDPALFDFISRFFHNHKWAPTCPDRN
jgi:hypothetical protein